MPAIQATFLLSLIAVTFIEIGTFLTTGSFLGLSVQQTLEHMDIIADYGDGLWASTVKQPLFWQLLFGCVISGVFS